MAFDAFISYSSLDKTAADATCAVLEGAGIRCWIAPRDMRAGAEYGAAIIEAIDHCRVMILVFSSSANESRQIHREIERAVAKGIPILPVRIEEVVPTKSMEYFLGAIHWLDALSPPLEKHLQQLAETVKAMLKIDTGPDAKSPDNKWPDDAHVALPSTAMEAGASSARRAADAAPPPRTVTTKPARPNWLLPAICGAVAAVLIGAGVWLYRPGAVAPTSATTPPPPTQAVPATLRASAQARNLMIGADVAIRPLRDDLFFSQTLAREYNFVAPSVETQFARRQKSRTEVDFANPDAIVEFAVANGMKLRGPALIDGAVPPWLAKGNFSPSETSTIIKEYIQTMVRRYRGRVYSWDISWGMFDNLGKPRQWFWSNALGEDYVEQVIAWAREADPQVKLFVHNNYDTGPFAPRAESTYDLLRKFKVRSVPIDGVALGTHLRLDQLPKSQEVVANMSRLAALGLEIHVIEFEVSLALPPTDQDLQRQATVYGEYLSACLSIATCKAFQVGGLSDNEAFAPNRWPGMNVGAAMPFDATYKPKPAYKGMLDALQARPGDVR
jgi:endo-1,4-beta-xylanase